MRIQLQGRTMEYEERGSGRPLLLIHGYPLNRAMWEPQLAGLAGAAWVIAPDLRGFGASEPVPGPSSMDLYADDCRALLDAVGAEGPAVVCGLSMGGYVAFAFYRKYADRVAGLILAATRAGEDSAEGKAGRRQAAELAREQGAAAIASALLPKLLSPRSQADRPDLVGRVRGILESASVEGIVGALTAMAERPDSTPTLAEIDRPTLILHGADDQLMPPREAANMLAAIRDSVLHIVPDAGHLPNLEQPEQFNNAVRRFLHSL